MLKLLEINGFRTSSTTYGAVEKYIDENSNYYFILKFTNFYYADTIYLFKDNIKDISKFNNILRNNGSAIIYNFKSSRFSLIGKKLMEIKDDARLYILEDFQVHPYDDEYITYFDINDQTDLSLLDIFKIEWSDDFSNPYWLDLLVA